MSIDFSHGLAHNPHNFVGFQSDIWVRMIARGLTCLTPLTGRVFFRQWELSSVSGSLCDTAGVSRRHGVLGHADDDETRAPAPGAGGLVTTQSIPLCRQDHAVDVRLRQ